MIIFSGYGLFLVIGIYVASFWGISKTALVNTSSLTQVIAILITCILSTAINYVLARFLNRHRLKHTVYGAKLENAVLFLGGILLFLVLTMLCGELKLPCYVSQIIPTNFYEIGFLP